MKKKFSEEVEALLEQISLTSINYKEGITIGEFIDVISRRGFGMVLLLLSLPAALPIPAVGYAIPFAVVIIFVGIQILIGRNSLWLPDRIRQRQIPPKLIVLLRQKGVPFLRRVEKWLGKQKKFMVQGNFRFTLGAIIALLGMIMAIPIPLTNTVPALVICIIGIGISTEDGRLIFVSLLAGTVLLLVYSTIAIFIFQKIPW